MSAAVNRLVCLGFGFSASTFAGRLDRADWEVVGTRRSLPSESRGPGSTTLLPFAGGTPSRELVAAVSAATHVLVSVPPGVEGDVVLPGLREALIEAPRLRWLGYLSSTGVYGDHEGATVDEESPCRPSSTRSIRRLAAENQWRSLHADEGLPVHVFRLAGIYGPGRSVLDRVRTGARMRIVRPGHVFSRIHVGDIARVLDASIAQPRPGGIYNVCDDEPAPQAEVIEYACHLLGVEPGPEVPFEQASAKMSPAALTFWNDRRRIDNRRLKDELGLKFRYPSYREGLRAIHKRST